MSIEQSPQINDYEVKEALLNSIKNEIKKIREYTPKVGIFGDTGVGKSSLCNAIFGKDVAEISNVEACTRHPQEILLNNGQGGGIILIDVPGVGEDQEHHDEYVELYKSLLPNLDLVIWAIKADDRKYLSSINVYTEIVKPNIDSCPVIFAVTQADKIEPYREWDVTNNRPSGNQLKNLQAKIIDISARFDVPTNKIVAVSASDSYNLVELVNKVVEALPNSKKFAFTREAKEENVSKEAAKDAEKGIFDYIKDYVGKAWDSSKEDIAIFLIESAVKNAPKILKIATSWFKNLF